MEIGSHDRLQEGVLSLELANGVSRYHNEDEASMETEPQRAGSVPPRQCWVAGHSKVSDIQQQQPCWSSSGGVTPGEPVHHANVEDAHNLVAFSAIAGSLPPSSSSSCRLVQPNTALLYDRFIQETGADGARLAAGAAEGSRQPPEDLNTLQTALSQAKHGHKPPNCDCEGPDCPDYLEWLEKKIKLATSEDQGASKMAEASPHLKAHVQQPPLQHHSQSYPQVNGGHRLSTSYSQQQQGSQGPRPDQVPCPKPPIPCSPQVLSIAKEKNVSLQTAIAIEALTQLSGTSPQAACPPAQNPYNSNLHHHQNPQNFPPQPPNSSSLIAPSPSSHSSSSRSQSVPPGLHTSQQAPVSCEHHRPQSQGLPSHFTPLPSATSPFPGQGKPQSFSPNPQQWQQSSDRGPEQRNPWMCVKSEPQSQSHFATAPHSSSDPMSELKQLLGDTSGKFSNSSFKLPVAQQLSLNQNGGIQDHPALSRIKQEPDSGEHYHHTASMGHYGMANGQQQGQHYPGTPLSPGQAAISHSTQAALQQHLHYKRNLFSNHSPGFGAPGPRPPLACQNLKKWWPQDAEGLPHLAIKQEPKEPKKKKSNLGSPVIKAMSGMLTGPPMPKPKQIIIKKTKQKASMPTFLPQTQITIQKQPVHLMDRAPALNSLQAGPPFLPLHSNSTQAAAAGLPAPAQSQVSISNSSMTPSSTVSVTPENTPALVGPLPPPVAPAAHAKSEGAGSPATSNTSTTVPPTSTFPSNTSQLPSLTNIDPKYEELIRQFEAEFGDSAPETSASQSMEATATGPQLGNQSQTSPQDLSPSSSSTSQLVPSNVTTQASSTPHPNDQEMEVNKDESGTQSEATLRQASIDSPVEEQNGGPLHVSLCQEAAVHKQQQQQPSLLEDNFSMPCSPLPKRMKLEASGDIAVLSTTCYSEEDTPTKDSLPCSPSLKGFLESPLRYLDTPTKSLLETPPKDPQSEFPTCTCVGKSVS